LRPENADAELHSARLSKVLHSAGNDAENQSHLGIGAEDPGAVQSHSGTAAFVSPQVLFNNVKFKNFLREVFYLPGFPNFNAPTSRRMPSLIFTRPDFELIHPYLTFKSKIKHTYFAPL